MRIETSREKWQANVSLVEAEIPEGKERAEKVL